MIDLTGTGDDVDAALVDLLAGWAPARRWFPVKGEQVTLRLTGTAVLARGDVEVRVLLLAATTSAGQVLLHVPVVLGGPGEPIGTLPDGTPVHDGAGHPAYLAAWLSVADGPVATGTPALGTADASVISGEQSNTSVVLRSRGVPTAILKVIRAPAAGENPDVDVPRRLTEVGWDAVPAPLGWLQARWSTPEGTVSGYVGALAAFVPDAEDGFELACALAGRREPFDGPAELLGATVAGMHRALRDAYGVVSTRDGAGTLAAALRARADWAFAAVPALLGYRPTVEATVARVLATGLVPPAQRVHGDLHLGQVLRSAGRWYVLDFEGEPLAPLAERTRPDLAVRDVAGVLRSFDYAAAVGGLTGADARAWTRSARQAFLTGHRAADTEAPTVAGSTTDVLLTAYELDKTLYEAVYEARNRPDWLAIPLAGLDRLAHDVAEAHGV